MRPTTDEARRARIRHALAAWYAAERRRLPWREEPTPYRVWVSEMMLQQTQVATVIPYFERFLASFPTVSALAAAPEDEVLSRWSGLGYYRRARFMHRAAQQVVADHDGALPRTADALRGLPGIGAYTAAAIASIANGEAAAVLDGNVARVLARLDAVDLEVNTTAGERALQALADALLDRTRPGDHNQAMMELGALVCAPTRPACLGCPLRDDCRAHAGGLTAELPRKKARARARAVHAVCGLARRGEDVLLARRPDGALLGGLWELPGGPVANATAPQREAVTSHFAERLGLDVSVGAHLATVEHVFTHLRLTLDVYAVPDAPRDPSALAWYTDWRWVAADAVGDAVPLSTLTRKVLAAAAEVAS